MALTPDKDILIQFIDNLDDLPDYLLASQEFIKYMYYSNFLQKLMENHRIMLAIYKTIPPAKIYRNDPLFKDVEFIKQLLPYQPSIMTCVRGEVRDNLQLISMYIYYCQQKGEHISDEITRTFKYDEVSYLFYLQETQFLHFGLIIPLIELYKKQISDDRQCMCELQCTLGLRLHQINTWICKILIKSSQFEQDSLRIPPFNLYIIQLKQDFALYKKLYSLLLVTNKRDKHIYKLHKHGIHFCTILKKNIMKYLGKFTYLNILQDELKPIKYTVSVDDMIKIALHLKF